MKKFIMFMAAVFTALTMNAQNYTGSSKFFDNWSVGLDGGVQTNLHDWNAPQGAVTNLSVARQITPIFGLGAEVGVGFNNNANWACGKFLDGTRHQALSHYNRTAIENLSAFANGTINLTNLVFGYNGTPRFFEVSALAGVGYSHWYDSTPNSGYDYLLTKAGLNLDFNVDKNRAWTLRLSPACIWNTTITGAYDCRFATGQVTLGVVYHFKTSNGTHHAVYPDLYDQDEVDGLNAAIEALKARKPQVVEKIVEKVVTLNGVDATYAVSFEQNSAVLSDAAKAILNGVPEGVTVNVAGSTSPEGTQKRNEALAVERAQAVADYLQSRGVKINTVSGGEAGRAAIVTIQ